MRDRLVELLEKAIRHADQNYVGKEWDGKYCGLMADYLLAEGVIVPPCKVGQDGYWVTSHGIVPVIFDKILLSVSNEWKVRARYFVKETAYFLFEDFGKTVFLTREEAEKALAERRGE